MIIQRILRPVQIAARTHLSWDIQSPQLLQGSFKIHGFAIVPVKPSLPELLVTSGASKASLHTFSRSATCPTPPYSPSVIPTRCKSKKKQYHSDDEDSDSDMDDNLEDDDFEAPPHFKVVTIHAPSLRTDAILSNALSISRHRLEELFFASCLRLNGEKLMKKGIKMDKGDYVDVIMEKLEGQIKVKRAKLLKIGSQKTGTDKFILKVRVWKTPFLLDYVRTRNRS